MIGFMLSNFISNNSIARNYTFIHFFDFFSHYQDISSKEDFCGRCPRPVSGIRQDFYGNTANARGIRPEHPLDTVWCPGFSFFRYWVSLSP